MKTRFVAAALGLAICVYGGYGPSTPADAGNQTSHKGHDGLTVELTAVDKTLIARVRNIGEETVAFPSTLELYRTTFFRVARGEVIENAHGEKTVEPPDESKLALAPLKPGGSVSGRWPLDEVEFRTRANHLLHMQVIVYIIPQKSKLEGLRTWTGTLKSHWEHVETSP